MTQNLSNELVNIQSQCIGLFKHRSFATSFVSSLELIIEEDDHTFVTVAIGNLFGLYTSTFGKDQNLGNLYYFPNNKTLSEMMNDPFKFNEWFVNTITLNK